MALGVFHKCQALILNGLFVGADSEIERDPLCLRHVPSLPFSVRSHSLAGIQNHPYYQFDFQYRGRRFHGSTGSTNRREAESVERSEREKARREVLAAQVAGGAGSLQMDHVCERYWQEVGQHHAGAGNTERDLARLVEYFGKAKLLTEIDDNDVARLVAWRRSHRAIPHNAPKDRKPEDYAFISSATVNRSTTEVLKKLFTRAKAWGIRFEHEPRWRDHILKEPQERVRELQGNEGQRLVAATRNDYQPLFEFAHVTGLRREECIHLRWSEVNWEVGQIVKLGKGGKRVVTPITTRVREILEPLKDHHREFCFTYCAARTTAARAPGQSYAATQNRKDRAKGDSYVAVRKQELRIKGQRYPLTLSGVNSAWKRLRKKAGVEDFRLHDFRHDFATKLLRHTGNLKLGSVDKPQPDFD
jgi:integrase